MTRTIVTCILAAGAATVIGCADESDITLPNLPPETYLALADSVQNPTVYTQTIRWWGTDPDGEVVGFEYRWFTDPSESSCSIDPAWVFTEETKKDFNLPVTDSMSTHRIEVRAIDDDGAADPEPSSLTLPVTNNPPTIKIWDDGALPDTTFPAFVVKWHGDDPEGSGTIDHYLLWLDGQEDSPMTLSPEDTVASLGYEDFGGTFGDRTLHLVAIDTGCDTSEVATYTWHVKDIEGDVLLVDDLANDYSGAWITNPFYRNALQSCVGLFSVLDLDGFGPSTADVATYGYNFDKLFELFGTVIWYSEPVRSTSSNLDLTESLVPSYVEAGGRLLLISLAAVGTNAAFPDSVFLPIFGIESLYNNGTTTNFDCKNWEVKGNADLGLDSLKVSGIFLGVECMNPAAGATPLYFIPPGTIGATQTANYYLGILNSWGSGKVGLVTFPISRSDGYGNAASEMCKIINLVLD